MLFMAVPLLAPVLEEQRKGTGNWGRLSQLVKLRRLLVLSDPILIWTATEIRRDQLWNTQHNSNQPKMAVRRQPSTLRFLGDMVVIESCVRATACFVLPSAKRRAEINYRTTTLLDCYSSIYLTDNVFELCIRKLSDQMRGSSDMS